MLSVWWWGRLEDRSDMSVVEQVQGSFRYIQAFIENALVMLKRKKENIGIILYESYLHVNKCTSDNA